MIKILFLVALAILPISAIAQDQAKERSVEPTRIEVDQKGHRILFFIEGELQAVLEKNRLTVEGDVLSDSYLHGVIDLQSQEIDGGLKP